tara:strand:- start:2523 stop:2804 length:282 start_codon:yes stop_codon:yes gene_type:complete
MLKIDCPWCGSRNEDEFSNGGESHLVRPEPPSSVTEDEWANYLFYPTNTKGPFKETWFHKYGCRQWFNVTRNTATHEILNVYRIGENPPEENS